MDLAEMEQEMRDNPTDLGGWANRASALLRYAQELEAALQALKGDKSEDGS